MSGYKVTLTLVVFSVTVIFGAFGSNPTDALARQFMSAGCEGDPGDGMDVAPVGGGRGDPSDGEGGDPTDGNGWTARDSQTAFGDQRPTANDEIVERVAAISRVAASAPAGWLGLAKMLSGWAFGLRL